MWSKVYQFIRKHNLLDDNELYIVALSGGADSVALLLLLKEHGFNVHAAHCNFHLRGDESNRDEAFCESLCREQNVPFHRVHFDTHTYAELHQVSIEMAARELRYRWFEQLRTDIGAAGVCVAHHRDDLVETVLMNMVRGTGVHGLVGIKARNGHVLRPFLSVSRDEIEHFLSERGQNYVTDSTNLADEATRNKVRHHLVPLLRQLNAQAVENIQRMAERMADVEEIVANRVKEVVQQRSEHSFEILEEFVQNAYLLYEAVRGFGFNSSQSLQLYETLQSHQAGSMFSSGKYDAVVDRGRILIEPVLKPMMPLKVPETGVYLLEDSRRFCIRKSSRTISKDPAVATVDAQKVRFPLVVRRVRKGDWMVPYGMKGRKLLSDLMTDLKFSIFDKRKQMVVVDAQDVIIWLVGVRVSAAVAVTDYTGEVLKMNLTPIEA